MRTIQTVLILSGFLFLQACGESQDDTPVQATSVTDLQAIVSYPKNPKEEVSFKQTSTSFENEHPVILPKTIPDEVVLTFPFKSDWTNAQVKAFTVFQNETREVRTETIPAKEPIDSFAIKILGLRNLFPDGTGLQTSLTLNLSLNGQTQVILFRLSTPPAVTTVQMRRVLLTNMRSIWLSPSLSAVPLMRFEIGNSSNNKWTIEVPYQADAQLIQTLKKVIYDDKDDCKVNTNTTESNETMTAKLLLIRSGISPAQFTKLPIDQPRQVDTFMLGSQEKVELTLYGLFRPEDNAPIFLGRKSTEEPQFLSPGCIDGKCFVQLAYRRVPAYGYRCGNGDILEDNGRTCKKTIKAICDPDGKCNFAPYKLEEIQLGECLEHYKDPMPDIAFSNYIEVTKTKLSFLNIFAGTRVRYTESAYSISEQSSTPPWVLDEFSIAETR